MTDTAIGPYNKPVWEAVLDAIDETRPIAWFGDKYEGKDTAGKPTGKPAVIYCRDSQYKSQTAAWIKQYQGNAQYNLRPFNQWEYELLQFVKDANKYVYQLIAFQSDTSYLRTKDDQRERSSSSIVTSSKGAAIKSWMAWPVRVGEQRYRHAFVPPGNYLRFAKAALTALNALHQTGVVHCDLNAGNWCLRPTFAHMADTDERIRLNIDWATLSLIDVGYAIHPAKSPNVTMPLDPELVSPHLKKALQQVTEAGEKTFTALPHPKTWATFNQASWEPAFWSTHDPYALDALRQVDWREDYWKLGQLLKRLRDGEASTGGTTLRADLSQSRAVNQLIGEAEQTDEDGCNSPAFGLPEDLIAWGGAVTDYETETGQDRVNAAKALREATHKALMQRLDAAIAQLRPEDEVTTVFVYRKDIDVAYAADQAARQTTEAIDKARQKDEAEQARQRQLTAEHEAQRLAGEARQRQEEARRLRRQRLAQWFTKARTLTSTAAADLAKPVVSVAVLFGALYAWSNGGEAVWRAQAKPTLSRWYDSAAERVRLATAPVVKPTDAGSAAPASTAAAVAAMNAAQGAPTTTPTTTAATAARDAANEAAQAATAARQIALQAAYTATTTQIEASPWWLKGRSQGIAPNAEQIAWANATVQHAQKDQWMLAQYALGALHCSAAHPGVARHSSGDCGHWLGRALANPAYGQDAMTSQKLRKRVTILFDDMVMGRMANGEFHDEAPDYIFARALLPGLQARLADTPDLALRAAYTQACATRPKQRPQAQQTLQGIAQQATATPEEAAQASRWLAKWQAGDYSNCAPA